MSLGDGKAEAFLAALQLADSFFPSGLFTQSHGMEQLIADGADGAAQIEPLLHSYLLHVAGPGDALAVRWVVRSALIGDGDTVAAIDARLEAMKLAPEARTASRRCGGRVLALGAELYESLLLRDYAGRAGAGAVPGHQAVALALLAAAGGLDENAAVLVELHTFAVSLISVAIRLGGLDHIAGQRLLRRARPMIQAAADLGANRDWRDIGGFAPGIELAQFRHASAEARMFVS